MTELKQTEIEFDVQNEPADSPIFKLKVTNLRKSAYPTNTPEESDLFKFKIGDYIGKPNSSNTIYQVVSIHREPITKDQIDRFNNRTKSYSSNTEINNTKQLFAEYQKNGNFGACRITIKPLVRGVKEIVKGKLVKFLEVDQIRALTYNGYIKVDLNSIVRTRDYNINSLNRKIIQQQDKLRVQTGMRDVILKIINTQHVLTAPVEVITTQEVDLAAA